MASFLYFVLGTLALQRSLFVAHELQHLHLGNFFADAAYKKKLTHSERIKFIETHNYWRSKVEPPAANMYRMHWAFEAEEIAQKWSRKCRWGRYYPDLRKRRYKGMGQNIHRASTFNITQVVADWVSEAKNYDYENNACVSECENYTQAVWGRSYVLGCGVTYCPDETFYFTVCNYFQKGNSYGTRPYVKGPPCSQCHACVGTLCDILGTCTAIESHCNVTDRKHCLCDEKFYVTAGSTIAASSGFYILKLLIISQLFR